VTIGRRDTSGYPRIVSNPIRRQSARLQTIAPPPGRRERKKVQTRQALSAAARELFARNGFEHTTVQEIADVADVSERTFFRYFDSKEDLLLPDLVKFFDAVADALRDRPVTESPLAAIHAATLDAVRMALRPGSLIPSIPGAQGSTPGIDRGLVKAFTAWEDRLAELLAQRALGAEPTLEASIVRLHADVTARVAISALRASMITARTRIAQGQASTADIPGLLARAFAIAQAGCPQPAP
jgi:AcrR family transcriptional regulator